MLMAPPKGSVKKIAPPGAEEEDSREGAAEGASPGSIVTSPRTVFSTTSVSPVHEMAVEVAKPVTAKELLLYFDPPESVEERLALRTELFEPPETRAKLEKLKAEMAKMRCGLCRTRLLFSMRCKCQKAFCPKHRNPQTHRCSVDFKQMERQHMRDELTKPTSERLKGASMGSALRIL
ncbi:hypothetical protein QR680_008774 [Steinernema hermaphroditum]|uniref:AN1-type domain-containing protein n=1 Tax=Steinernema hermaphroditum TaxID=289476 RepID=A0AA39IHW1_9BILA|nr:hypothetical protein QR680_008774 [Steinernema hermaphroditum]